MKPAKISMWSDMAVLQIFSQEWPGIAVAVVVVGITLAVTTAVLVPLWRALDTFLLQPLRLRRIMAKQGVQGPEFRLFFGNSAEAGAFAQTFPDTVPLLFEDYQPTATPQYELFFAKYGKRFIYSVGSETRLVVRDAEMAKEVLSNKMGHFERTPLDLYIFGHLVGNGVFSVKDEEWALQRRTLDPFFSQESLKAMVASIVKSAEQELEKWEQLVVQAGGALERDVEHDVHVIARKVLMFTAFGDAYETGKQIFELQEEIVGHLFAALANPNFWIPGYRLLPTKQGTAMARLNDETESLIMKVIKDRTEAIKKGERDSFGDDMLGRMLAACHTSDGAERKFGLDAVFNNCKNFFFAGQDTAANLTCFSILMFANRQDWQERARTEISEVLGDRETCTFNDISRLKIMQMFVQEVSRLFAVSPSMARTATKDIHLTSSSLFIPKGLSIEIAALAIHRDPSYWGEDAHLFNPDRFTDGVSHACTTPAAFLPFGLGPRRCIADRMAMLEVKTVCAMLLRRFRVEASENYRHCPVFAMVVRPKFGLPVVLKRLG